MAYNSTISQSMIANFSRITILNYSIKPLHIGIISVISSFMWTLSIYTTWLLNIKYAKKLLLAKKIAKVVVKVMGSHSCTYNVQLF